MMLQKADPDMRPILILAAAFGVMLPALPVAAQEAAAAAETTAPDTAAPVLPAISVAEVTTRVITDRVIASGLIGAIEEVQVQPLSLIHISEPTRPY